MVATAERAASLPLKRIILEEPEQLSRTAVVQPAILLVEWLACEALSRLGREPTCVAGHSLGEFAALAAAGVIPWPVAFGLVALRGRLMERAAMTVSGGMTAILGLSEEQVAELASQAGCYVANLNAPGQVVISGEGPSLKKAAELAERLGGKAIPLKVAGPFHSPYMAEAEGELARAIEEVEFSRPRLTFISSVSGEKESAPEAIKVLLARQMTSPVLWTKTLRSLEGLGVKEAWEVGPGEVLSRLGKRSKLGIRFLALKEVMGDV
ncbi:MAG: Malonyl CoA-acyl carrier protein transacylase [Acetothermia bacterium 64_32]|nr:MAG: Malonyl CoA-acyl carrier protein transacylase [Acetothermia bacterium 64_32]